MKRIAAVAGSFYPGRESALRSAIEKYTVETQKEKVFAILSPHAGYLYSGMGAGIIYSKVRITDTVIILGTQHQYGEYKFALYPYGSWETPLGEVMIEETLSKNIVLHCPDVEENAIAHEEEHSIEVQVPFLQYFKPEVKIVPIIVSIQNYDKLKSLGEGISEAIKESKKDALIIASSDMSHTRPSNPAKQKKISQLDRQALEKLSALDDKGFYDFIRRNSITMCGFAPATVAIIAAKSLGATSGEIVDYRTSYDVTGDYSYVVGYGGVIIK